MEELVIIHFILLMKKMKQREGDGFVISCKSTAKPRTLLTL